ncbi:monooxygenase [Escherichia coli]|nr:monooxygenase [Escherichia coli]
MAHLATQWLSSLNRLLSRLIRKPGFLWKVWTESEKNHEAGGIYLFSDEKSALTYLEKHTARLKNLGVEEVVAKVFDVNVSLSQFNQAKLA